MIVLINGILGVGKTTVSQAINDSGRLGKDDSSSIEVIPLGYIWMETTF